MEQPAYDTNYPDHLTQLTQQLGGGTAVTDYKYDTYGNITQKTLPENANGQRMWYKYRYEPEMNMYVEQGPTPSGTAARRPTSTTATASPWSVAT